MAGGKDIHEVTNEAVGQVIARTERDIIRAYSEMIRRVLKKLPLVNMGFVKGDGKTWEDLRKHPMFRKALHEEVERMTERWERATREGIGRGWWMGERESDAVVDGYFAGRSVPRGLRNSYKHRNNKALQAFLTRGNGFYSRRVWQEGERVERHLCDSIAEGLTEGMSAQKMSRKIREDLRYPDKLFRRVRNKYGELVLSRNARAFHPGQGVYRSSYKNAMRLARTEINTAYRTADHERWQEMDFVKGIRVSLSNNHTCNGVPFRDICDDLQGVYPKGFKFTSWHPMCRCVATPIMEDFEEFLKRKINGGEARKGVEEVPRNFKDWVRNNGARIEEAGERGRVPYFLKDNARLVDKGCGTNLELPLLKKDTERIMAKAKEVGDEVQATAERIAGRYGATCTPINYKSEQSIMRKVMTERNSYPAFSVSSLKDTARTTIIAERKDIDSIIDELSKEPSVKLFQRDTGKSAVKRQTADRYMGYTGTIVNLKMPNGLLAEVQVNTPKMIYAKEPREIAEQLIGKEKWLDIRRETGLEGGLGHKLYERMRVLANGSKEYQKLVRQSIEYYAHFQD